LLTYPLGEEEREEEETYSKAYDVKKSLQHKLKKSWEYRLREETKRTDRRKNETVIQHPALHQNKWLFSPSMARKYRNYEALQEHQRTDSTQK
jgi:hypothetical protein